MDVEINNVIYIELNSGPKIVNSTCGKTINLETIDRDSTVIRIFTNNSRRDSCRHLFKQLGILTLPSQYIYTLLIFVVRNGDLFT